MLAALKGKPKEKKDEIVRSMKHSYEWSTHKGMGCFDHDDAYEMKVGQTMVDGKLVNDIEDVKQTCLDKGYHAFVIWRETAYFRKQAAPACRADMKKGGDDLTTYLHEMVETTWALYKWNKYPDQDCFDGEDDGCKEAHDMEAVKEYARFNWKTAFVTWDGKAYFRRPGAERCRAALRAAPGADCYLLEEIPATKIVVAVASTSFAEKQAVQKALGRYLREGFMLEIIGVEVPAVGGEPDGMEETRMGALTRLAAVRASRIGSKSHFCIAFQAGVEEDGNEHTNEFAVICIQYRDDEEFVNETRTAPFLLPLKMQEHIKDGSTHREATQKFFDGHLPSDFFESTMGTVGAMSDAEIDQVELYTHPVSLAMVPYIGKNPLAYGIKENPFSEGYVIPKVDVADELKKDMDKIKLPTHNWG